MLLPSGAIAGLPAVLAYRSRRCATAIDRPGRTSIIRPAQRTIARVSSTACTGSLHVSINVTGFLCRRFVKTRLISNFARY